LTEAGIASPQDLAAMKLDAISRRGTRRDFVDLYFVYGQTASGRYLFVALDREAAQRFYTVTARDMTDSERKGYRKQQGGR